MPYAPSGSNRNKDRQTFEEFHDRELCDTHYTKYFSNCQVTFHRCHPKVRTFPSRQNILMGQARYNDITFGILSGVRL
jgi:hypothetical protein